MIIEIEDGDETVSIASANQTAERALEAHGYDPNTTDYTIRE